MKFFARSLLILLALYGLVFAVGDAYLAHAGAHLGIALGFAAATIAIQYLLAPVFINWMLDIYWDEKGTELPAATREFLDRLCAQRGIDVPRIGIIYSGTPNAFCFGYTPGHANLVVTSGLLETLTPEEANAVLAHEVGHIEHWDFVVMAIAALAPLLLYQVYAFTDRINNLRVVAFAAYACYWLGQFLVLLLNRTREYFADGFSAEVTRAPDVLSSALVKVAYGMIHADGERQKTLRFGATDEKKAVRREQRWAGALGLMGVSSARAGSALALASADPARAAAVMRWDLVNPWAGLYEINSTHPKTALRVRALNEQAQEMHQSIRYPLPEDQRVAWGSFPLEVALWAAPGLCAAAIALIVWQGKWMSARGLGLPPRAIPALLVFGGVAWMLRVYCRYRGEFQPAAIGQLIEDVEVSEMRPRAVRLEGEILGQGVPGAFWSPDLVLQDSTGMLFVLYRQSIPLARFFFAITEAEKWIGKKVAIEGWFRRGTRPYVEMSRLTGEDGKAHRTYSRWVQYALAAAAVAIGWAWLSIR
ncbi:MAG: M48 family metalloprotease [Bryobacteraceae bacterium]|jgi:heat shock protein HtpX